MRPHFTASLVQLHQHIWQGHNVPLIIALVCLVIVLTLLLVCLMLLLLFSYKKSDGNSKDTFCISEDSLLHLAVNPLPNSTIPSHTDADGNEEADDLENVIFDKIRDIYVPRFYSTEVCYFFIVLCTSFTQSFMYYPFP